MLQTLLSERFRLAVHHDRKDQAVYALVVGRNGLKLEKVADTSASVADDPGIEQAYTHSAQARRTGNGDAVIANGFYGPMRLGRGGAGGLQFEFQRLSMPALAALLTPHVDRIVVDETHLTGRYRLAFQNERRPEGSGASRKTGEPAEAPGQVGSDARRDPYGESLLHAIEKAGLKLEARQAPVDIIVVDHMERSPTAN
jgi:uncharacterized protein (TIGR03435 family)